jgi:hypothetical protein
MSQQYSTRQVVQVILNSLLSIVSALVSWFGQQIETRQGMSSRTADPSADQADPDGEARGGEDRLKGSQEVEPPIEARVHRLRVG